MTDDLRTTRVDPLDATAPAPPPRRRGSRRASGATSPLVTVPAVVVAALMLVPAAYLVVQASELPLERIVDLITAPETVRLTVRTVGLAFAVTTASLLLGVPLAWLTVRSDLPGRRFFAVATALPLVIPTYVGAYAILATFAPGGLVESWLGIRPPSPYGFVGAFAALTLFTYPYVLLTCQSALRGIDPAFEEASRSLGRGPVMTFLRVTLPQLRPAAAAGGLLVSLYVLSDFGAVSMLRYSTFTRALYTQFRAAFDRAPAAVLGLVLVALTLVVLVVEARVSRDRGGQFRSATTARRATTVPLRRWRWPAAAFAATVVAGGLVVPVTVVCYWLVRGIRAGEAIDLVIGAAGRSLLAALLGAVVATIAALPIGIWAARSPSRLARGIERLSFTGYALPGIVVALALVYVGIRVTPTLYQTLAMLVFAYVVLFLPQAVGAIRTSLMQVPTTVEEASRTLGAGRVRTLFRLVLPLSGRGAVTGGALVFLTAMKELPATLLLAPTGYDTLAVRVWSATREAFFARAAAPALLLILLGSLPLAVLTIRSRHAR
ncbi:ABC transporter permease [Nitriliruptor alkaliphilus]|uniref:ABC transporter permease n=1 Tax=Nitriliruptor alkaliphilus TaxID=427918 RepID=UPI0009F841B3|nr:iron ABC transporter permease [Nitriliruptor alkaliphilus]